MNNLFKTKNGRVSSYALLVGFVEREKIRNINLAIKSSDGYYYDVVASDIETGKILIDNRFTYVNDARKAFDTIKDSLTRLAA